MRHWSSSELYLRLLKYVRPYWRTFALGVLGMIVIAITEPALPALMKPLLDGTFVDKDQTLMRWMPAIIIALVVVRGAAEFMTSYTLGWVSNTLVMDLRQAMFDRLLVLPTAVYDDRASGNLISKLTYDVTQVTAAATNVLLVIFKDTLSLIGLLGWMFWLNWKLTLLALVMTPLIVAVVRKISVRLRHSSYAVQQGMGAVTQVLQETIEGQKVVKLFGGQRYEATRFAEQTDNVRRYMMKQATAAGASVPVVQFLAGVALAAMVYLAAHLSASNEITVGEFVSFITAMLMLTSPLKRITSVNDPLQRGLAAAQSVFELIDQPAETDDGRTIIKRARGEIRFENVGFVYEGGAKSALHEISLTIAPGETVALVGASGSGKTTLANLVPRFYHPTSGRITLDDVGLEDLQLASLRANIALVSQDVVLFNDTVGANIAYGAMRETSAADITAAADAAHAMEFIRQMPQGLATLVGENGVKLSGGQRQRLAIARALLRNAPILILDEATSALDAESERHVQAALEALMQGRTTIVIAHRLSTIESADRIVVLAHGRIVETGRHRELLAVNGAYANLYRTQYDLAQVDETPLREEPSSVSC